MNEPSKPVEHKVVYHDGDTIIIRHTSEEFGTDYELMHPKTFGGLNFSTFEKAYEHVKFLERK